jgi:hypothetical protein
MFARTLTLALLLSFTLESSASAATCDRHCKIDALFAKNVGIVLDKPVTLAAIRKLGKVKADNLQQRPNPNYPAKNDTVHHLAIDGGLFVHAAVTPEHAVIVERIQLTNPKIRLPFNLAIGATPAVITKTLGTPDQTRTGAIKNGEELVYLNTEQTETLTFAVQDGTLKAVIWDFTPGD